MARRRRKAPNGFARPYQRRPGLWVCDLRHAGQRHVLYGKTEAEALDKRNQLREQLRIGAGLTGRTGQRLTVNDLIACYLSGDFAPYTLACAHAVQRQHISPGLGSGSV